MCRITGLWFCGALPHHLISAQWVSSDWHGNCWSHVQEVTDSLSSFNSKTFTRLASVIQSLTIVVLSLVFAWFRTLTGYVQGVLLVATADALLLGLGLWIIGVPLVMPLMLLMFLTAFIPFFFGPLIAGVMTGLVGSRFGIDAVNADVTSPGQHIPHCSAPAVSVMFGA